MKTVVALLSLSFVNAAFAASVPTPPPVQAVRLTSPISVDGVLSEPVWQGGNAVTEFRQRDPVEGGTPSQRTEVRVAYDEDALYVGARLYDSAPDSIISRLSRRDVSIPADRFSIYLDPYHDKQPEEALQLLFHTATAIRVASEVQHSGTA